MYVAVMFVLVSLCGKLFVSGLRLSTLGTQAMDRMMDVTNLQRDFTQAVRSASAVVPELGTYRSGEAQLVLRAEPQDGCPHYIVFGALRDPQHLSRMDLVEKDGKLDSSRFVTYRVPVDSIRFDMSGPGFVQLDVMAQGRQECQTARRFVAAPRGIGEQP